VQTGNECLKADSQLRIPTQMQTANGQKNDKNSAIAQMASQCCISRIFAFEWGYFSLTLSQ